MNVKYGKSEKMHEIRGEACKNCKTMQYARIVE